jgi:hypothetical protein
MRDDIHYFGGCPHCGGENGYFNLGTDQWFKCDEHKVKWLIGSLFSSCRFETEEDWARNEARYADYEIIDPLYPRRSLEQTIEGSRLSGFHPTTEIMPNGVIRLRQIVHGEVVDSFWT